MFLSQHISSREFLSIYGQPSWYEHSNRAMVLMPVDIDDRHDDLPVKVAETVHGNGVETVMTICSYSRAEGSLEGKLPTIWTDEKQSREEAARRERLGERR